MGFRVGVGPASAVGLRGFGIFGVRAWGVQGTIIQVYNRPKHVLFNISVLRDCSCNETRIGRKNYRILGIVESGGLGGLGWIVRVKSLQGLGFLADRGCMTWKETHLRKSKSGPVVGSCLWGVKRPSGLSP